VTWFGLGMMIKLSVSGNKENFDMIRDKSGRFVLDD